MQRGIVKQVFFLILLALAIVLVMGTVFFTNVKAQVLKKDLFSRFDWDWDDDWGYGNRFTGDIRYNRVEGLYLGFRVRKEYWQKRYPTRPFLFGLCGYSVKARELQYQIGIEKGFFEDNRLALGGEYHRLIDTPDRWIMPETENSLAAFFIKEDFHDFFLREGGSGTISQNFGRVIEISAGYHFDKLDSLQKNTNWSLFGGKKTFRENPAMDAGDIRSILGRVVVDSRNSVKRTTRGWYTQIEWEHAGNGMGGVFDFDRLLVDVRRYQPIGFGEGIDFRFRAGTSHGYLPWQRTFHLGGMSTLRGFPYKAFPAGPMNPGGNRMLLAQIEYRMGESNFPDEIGLGIFDLFNFIIFADAGWAFDAGPDTELFDGFEQVAWSKLKSDVGVALANRSGSVRIEVARRTDTSKKPFTVAFRINRAF
ncbi:MAG: BamA/TamA family outer membrane protein [bacterium]